MSNGFSLNNLHQPFRPPTHDALANPIANAGSECISIKNITLDPNPFPTTGTDNESAILSQQCRSTILRPVTRIGGSSIHNFAESTSTTLGDVEVEVGSNATYQMYFSSELKAREAWKTTIWHKLGFSYDQLNSEKHKERHKTYNNPEVVMVGITTDANYDGSILNSISSQVNPAYCTPAYGSLATDVVTGIQFFNESGIATPKVKRGIKYPTYKNQLYASDIGMYVGSLYAAGGCTQIHVTTTGRAIVARNLPTLSIYGYYLITGDIVSNEDIVKEGETLPILGVVPKSSLSNQDFFSVNNEIEHVTTSQQKIGSIKIQILNPDLTPPQLEENSSVVLRITKPPQIPTN